MAKQQTPKRIDISGVKIAKPKAISPISNKSRWIALRLLVLIRQLEAVAEIDPTKVNIKEYRSLLEAYTEANMTAVREKRIKRNARDQRAAAGKGMDANGLQTDNAAVSPAGTGEEVGTSVDLRVPPQNPFARKGSDTVQPNVRPTSSS